MRLAEPLAATDHPTAAKEGLGCVLVDAAAVIGPLLGCLACRARAPQQVLVEVAGRMSRRVVWKPIRWNISRHQVRICRPALTYCGLDQAKSAVRLELRLAAGNPRRIGLRLELYGLSHFFPLLSFSSFSIAYA